MNRMDVTEKIMPVSVALGADGQPTAALAKKLEAKGIPLAAVAGSAVRFLECDSAEIDGVRFLGREWLLYL